jgi:uncharacterized membrane protein
MRLWILTALACMVTAPLHASDIPPSVAMSGFAKYEFNKWLFRSCTGSGKTSTLQAQGLPFIDATPERVLFTSIQQGWKQSAEPLRGVYLEFAGFTENGRVTATDMQRSLGWVDSCAQRPSNIAPGARLWAAGNEPGWSFVVDGKVATFRTLDAVLKFPAEAAKSSEGTITYVAESAGDRIRVELTPGLCSDTMSEAAFGRRAVAAVRGALYTGCGLVR